MRIFNRFFLFLYSVAFLTVATLALLIGIDVVSSSFLNDLFIDNETNLGIIFSSIIAIVFSVYFIIISIKSNNSPAFSNRISEIGEIRISTETLESIASKVSTRIKGVKEQKVRVRLENDDLVTIVIKVSVDGETPIPQLSEEIQLHVKDTVEKIAGIAVDRVHVIVTSIVQTKNKARIE